MICPSESENTHFSLFASAWNTSKVFVMSHNWNASRQNDRAVEIKNELVQLYNQQTEFHKKGGRSKHTEAEMAEYEKRRERVRALFAELESRNAA